MGEISLNVKHILSNDSTENWESQNPLLKPGEIIYDKTKKDLKINYNNQDTNFKDLDYLQKIDQTYNPESENAQSGAALAKQFSIRRIFPTTYRPSLNDYTEGANFTIGGALPTLISFIPDVTNGDIIIHTGTTKIYRIMQIQTQNNSVVFQYLGHITNSCKITEGSFSPSGATIGQFWYHKSTGILSLKTASNTWSSVFDPSDVGDFKSDGSTPMTGNLNMDGHKIIDAIIDDGALQ